MTKNTITTIEALEIGDKFKVLNCEESFIKMTAQPVRLCKKLIFYAKPVKGIIPKQIRNKTQVIFISKTKQIVI